MYSIKKTISEQYGNLIEIIEGSIISPFEIVNLAIKEKRLWQESGINHIRFMVNGQVMTTKQMEKWSNLEYQNLPKCYLCAIILHEDIYTNEFSDNYRFCSKNCADKNYMEELEKVTDEEEHEIDL